MLDDYNNSTVLAIVVSYNDTNALSLTVNALATQVGHLIIVDNGSGNDVKNYISHKFSKRREISILFLSKNMGIGAAVNLAFKSINTSEFNWVLTMDQDSIAHSLMVANLVNGALKINKTGIACPSFGQKNLNKGNFEFKLLDVAITSGSLTRINIFRVLNGLNENYFIDSVDFEFSLRVKNIGYEIVQVQNANLAHSLGATVIVNRFGFKINYMFHSPLRRYYIFRNNIFLTKNFFFSNAIFITKKNIFMLIMLAKIICFDPYPLKNLHAIYFGIIDGLRGRSGKCLIKKLI